MRAMTGVRTILPLSLSLSLSLVSPLPPSVLSSRLPLSICSPLPCCLSLSPFLPSSLLSIFLSSSLSGITLVDEMSPVDEPSNSDQVTEGVQFAYTHYHNSKSTRGTIIRTQHWCSSCVCVCTVCVGLCACMDLCGVYAQGECWRHERESLIRTCWDQGMFG